MVSADALIRDRTSSSDTPVCPAPSDQPAATRSFTKEMSRCFISAFAFHNTSSGTLSNLSHTDSLTISSLSQFRPRYVSRVSRISGPRKVAACTPLVTCEMGTMDRGTPGHTLCHIFLATRPWRRLTPLAAHEHFNARTVMVNGSFGAIPTRPRARKSSAPRPTSRMYCAK